MLLPLGWGREIFRVSPDPVIAFEGSDVLFQWNLRENLTTQPDFEGLVFGIWRNGYLATYFTTVTRNEQVIPNPGLRDEAPQFDGRVQWRGDLSKSLVAFQISAVSFKDQMDYGLLLNFGPHRNSPSDSVSLKVEGKQSNRSLKLIKFNYIQRYCTMFYLVQSGSSITTEHQSTFLGTSIIFYSFQRRFTVFCALERVRQVFV